MRHLYSVKNLRFQYTLGKSLVSALDGVSFDLPAGALACLSGPSGSGKSTLLNLLGLIEEIQEGDVVFEGRSYKSLSEGEKAQVRKFDYGFVFQSFHLFPVLSAEENVEFFLARQGLPRTERLRRSKEALESLGIWEHRKKRPLEMSGGQRQRVAIARALAKKPKVILADEPTASLDQNTGSALMESLKKLNREQGVAMLVCSHDPMVQAACPLKLALRDGKLVEEKRV